MNELKPCPFCGSSIVFVERPGEGTLFYCQCGRCGAATKVCSNKDAAAAFWNRRADNATLDAEPVRHSGWSDRMVTV